MSERNIAVSIEETSAAERVTLFALAFLSEHTAQDHRKAVFAKTSTRNRRTLLTRALGT